MEREKNNLKERKRIQSASSNILFTSMTFHFGHELKPIAGTLRNLKMKATKLLLLKLNPLLVMIAILLSLGDGGR